MLLNPRVPGDCFAGCVGDAGGSGERVLPHDAGLGIERELAAFLRVGVVAVMSDPATAESTVRAASGPPANSNRSNPTGSDESTAQSTRGRTCLLYTSDAADDLLC